MNPITTFRGQYRFLSNFYPSIVKLYDGVYQTAEHAYQASKTSLPHERESIRLCRTPGRAKHMGSGVTLHENWEQTKLHMMTSIVTLKFTTHDDLTKALLATEDAHLEERNSWGDTYWGVYNGIGENHLGKILMEVRLLISKN